MNWIDELVSDSPLRAKIGWKGELEFDGASEDDSRGRRVRFRIVRKPEDFGLAHPFSTFTRRKGKKAGQIFDAAVYSVASSDVATYQDEMMLTGWSDGPSGSKVDFMLSNAGDRNPFLGYSRASKDSAGSRFMAVFVEQDDQGLPVDQEQRDKVERKQKLSNVAAMLIKFPRFHDWLRETVEDVQWDTKRADGWLKGTLKIDSKAKLDDPRAGTLIALFEKIRKAYTAWLEDQGDRYDR